MTQHSLPRIWKYFFLLFSCLSATLFAQTETSQIDINTLSFNQLDSLFMSSQNDDFKNLEAYAHKMLAISRNNNDVAQKSIAFYNLAIAHQRQGKKVNFSQAIDSLQYHATQSNDSYMLANSFNLKGNIAFEEGNLDEAFSNYEKIISVNATSEDQYMTLVALYNIALIKRELQTPKDALKDVHAALKGYVHEKDLYNEISAIHLIGELHLDMYRQEKNTNYLDSTQFYVDSGLKKSKQYNDTFGYFLLLSTQGQWFHATKQYDKSLNAFQEALAYFDKNNNTKWKIFLYLYLGRLYDEQNAHKAAIDVLEKAGALLTSKKVHFIDTSEIYLLLTKNYFSLNSIEQANQYLEKYKSLRGKIQQDNRKLYARLQNAYDVSVLEKKIAQIETQADYRQKIILLITIVSIVGIGIVALFYYRRNRHHRKKLAEILEKIDTENTNEKTNSTFTNSSKIEDTEVKRILTSLAKLEETEYFLAISCTLNSIAKEIDTNTSYLSKIVNEYKGKSFANYLNEYRINKVLIKLKSDKHYQQYTLKYIAEQFGFARHETFSRVFKKQTGISPSYYLKKIKHDNL